MSIPISLSSLRTIRFAVAESDLFQAPDSSPTRGSRRSQPRSDQPVPCFRCGATGAASPAIAARGTSIPATRIIRALCRGALRRNSCHATAAARACARPGRAPRGRPVASGRARGEGRRGAVRGRVANPRVPGGTASRSGIVAPPELRLRLGLGLAAGQTDLNVSARPAQSSEHPSRSTPRRAGPDLGDNQEVGPAQP